MRWRPWPANGAWANSSSMKPEQLPEEFLARLQQIVPAAHWPRVRASFATPRRLAFRLNPLRGEPQQVLEELAELGLQPEPVNGLPLAYTLPATARPRLTHAPAHEEGRLYVQGIASMLAGLLLAPRPGERILDLAAAPGGKTLHLAAMMHNQGWISAVEQVKPRYYRLKANVLRHGAHCVHTYLMDGARVWRKCPEQFDRVLLDAPCSSEARFQLQQADSFAFWSRRKIREMSRKQGRLLFSAVQSLKPGGCLLYATCSFAPEENEAPVSKILRTFGDALSIEALQPPLADAHWQPGLTHWQGKAFAPAMAHSLRLLPDERVGGFYLCKLRKHRSTLRD